MWLVGTNGVNSGNVLINTSKKQKILPRRVSPGLWTHHHKTNVVGGSRPPRFLIFFDFDFSSIVGHEEDAEYTRASEDGKHEAEVKW